MTNKVKVITEVDLDEVDIDDIGGCTVPRYFIDENNTVHQCWIVRPGKSDSQPYGKLVQPLTDERIDELANKYWDECWRCLDEHAFARAIEKELLGERD